MVVMYQRRKSTALHGMAEVTMNGHLRMGVDVDLEIGRLYKCQQDPSLASIERLNASGGRSNVSESLDHR